MNKIIKISLVSLLSISLLTGCGCNKKEEKKETNNDLKVNTNEEVIKDQEVEVFKFTNTSLVYQDGNSVLETLVTNTSNVKQYLEEFKIHVKDSKGEEIVTMTGFIGDSIDANASKVITSTYGDDLSKKAVSISYEIVK